MTDSKNHIKRETDQNPSLTMIFKRAVFLALELLLGGGCLCAQDSPIAGGTLNVVFANKHGFVLATDSRMTAGNGHYTDDSQKLFRIGKHSALVIAGFASASAPGTPLDTQVARLLRGQFSPEQDLDFDGPDLKGWMNVAMRSQLQTIGSVYGTYGYTQMGMIAIAAGYDKKKPHIMRFDFKPTYKPISGAMLPDFDTVITTTDVTKFTYATSGITEIAESILSGTYPSSDPTILRYLAAKKRQRLNGYPLFELRKLAKVILSETEKHTRYVGGPDQTILIPRKGNAVLDSPVWPITTQRPLRTFLFRGLPSNIKLTTAQEIATMGFSGPFRGDSGEPLIQVFVSGALKDVDVSLDGNIFAGFTFLGVTFKYKGGSFWFGDNNRVQDCLLEVEEGTTISPGNPLMSRCMLVRRKNVEVGPNAVGRPFKNTCAVTDEKGQVRNEERASCPAGSQTVLMMFTPIPAMRSQPSGEPAK